MTSPKGLVYSNLPYERSYSSPLYQNKKELLNRSLIKSDNVLLRGLIGIDNPTKRSLPTEHKLYYERSIQQYLDLPLSTEVNHPKQTRKYINDDPDFASTTVATSWPSIRLVLKPIINSNLLEKLRLKLCKVTDEVALRKDLKKVLDESFQERMNLGAILIDGLEMSFGYMTHAVWTEELEAEARYWCSKKPITKMHTADVSIPLSTALLPFARLGGRAEINLLEPCKLFANGAAGKNTYSDKLKHRFSKSQFFSMATKEEILDLFWSRPEGKRYTNRILLKMEAYKVRHFVTVPIESYVTMKPIVDYLIMRFPDNKMIYPLVKDKAKRMLSMSAMLSDYNDVTYIPIDQKGFDENIPTQLVINILLWIKDTLVVTEDPVSRVFMNHAIDKSIYILEHSYALINGRIEKWHDGLASGLPITNIIGSLANLCYNYYALGPLWDKVLDICCMGDDTQLALDGKYDLEQIVIDYELTGARVNVAKNFASTQHSMFLKTMITKEGLYGYPLRDVSGMLFFKPNRNFVEDEGLPIVLQVLQSFMSRLLVWDVYDHEELDNYIRNFFTNNVLKDIKRHGIGYLTHPWDYRIRSRPRDNIENEFDLPKMESIVKESWFYSAFSDTFSVSEFTKGTILKTNLYSRLEPDRWTGKISKFQSFFPFMTEMYFETYKPMATPTMQHLLSHGAYNGGNTGLTTGYYDIDTMIVQANVTPARRVEMFNAVISKRSEIWKAILTLDSKYFKSTMTKGEARLLFNRIKTTKPVININPIISNYFYDKFGSNLAYNISYRYEGSEKIGIKDIHLARYCIEALMFDETCNFFRNNRSRYLIYSI